MTEPQRPRLQLIDATAAPDETVLGLWAVAPAAEPVFDVSGEPAVEPPTWRITLPATPDTAAASIAEAEADLDAAERALDEALARLARFASGAPGDVTFEVGGEGETQPPADPEARLAALLQTPVTPGDITFGLGDEVGSAWQEASRQFMGFLDRLRRLIANYAWVETYGGERRIGWTVVGWTGDTDTWQPALSLPLEAELHQRALDLALRSRLTMIRLFVLAARGAIILSRAIATPLGPVLAVPAAWRFIQDVLAELHQDAAAT